LYSDGKLIGESSGRPAALKPAATVLKIARSWQDASLDVFRVNGLNGAFDTVRVYGRVLTTDEIAGLTQDIAAPPATASLQVPTSRFAADLQRPLFHPMPTANWTNEPHGLVRRGDTWHMFYQRTPNGPFKTEMHWGHMASSDLVEWTQMPDAIWPTLQTATFGFDMKGIWSGDVVMGPHGAAYAFYTSVNHSPKLFNPGISVAISTDPDLRTWRKRGPVLDSSGLRDFRDPYVWQENGEWRMIVGAAMAGSGGGLAYYRCADIDNIKCWKKQPQIAPFEQMDVGSDIWEMPVFEAIGVGKYILVANPIGRAVSKFGRPPTRAVYWIGAWDGKQFRPDSVTPKMLDLIPGHLSPTVERDQGGQLVGIGIVDERRSTQAQKDAGWAHTFGLPRVWRLLADGKTLGQSPLPALVALRRPEQTFARTVTPSTDGQFVGDLGRIVELIADFAGILNTGPYGVVIASSPDGSEVTRLTYDPSTRHIILDKRRSSLSNDGEGPMVLTGSYDEAAFGVPRKFHIFVDHSVVDVFINDAAAFSFRIYPTRRDSTRFGIVGGALTGTDLEAWALRPAKVRLDLSPDTIQAD
jgi:beta-fructofuranosidase